jgi:acetyl/propionyl-CoA carboxylase alpha subunit
VNVFARLQIGISYDPMIAKVIAHGESRAEAISNLAEAIGDRRVAGFPTNVDFLGQILQLPAFKDAELNTNFIRDNKASLPLHCLGI